MRYFIFYMSGKWFRTINIVSPFNTTCGNNNRISVNMLLHHTFNKRGDESDRMCETPKGHVNQLFIPLVKSTWEKQTIAHAYVVISSDQGLEAKKVSIIGESRKQGVVAAEFGTIENVF